MIENLKIKLVLTAVVFAFLAEADVAQQDTGDATVVFAKWATPVNLSGSDDLSDFPVIESDADGNVNLAWVAGQAGKLQVHYSQWNGKEWSQPIKVTNSDSCHLFPTMALDGTGTLHLACMELTANNSEILYLRKRGDDWSQPIRLSTNDGVSQRPQMTVDSLGRAHCIWFDNTDRSYDIFHCQLVEHDWTKPSATKLFNWYLTEDSNYTLAPAVAADDRGHLHMTWIDLVGVRVNRVVYSEWDGTGWSKPIEIAKRTEDADTPAIEVDSDGNVHVAWREENRLWTCRRKGKTWSEPLSLTDGSKRSELPTLAAGAHGHVHLVYVDQPAEYGSIHYRQWDVHHWSKPKQVSNGLAKCFLPSITVAADEKVHIVWSAPLSNRVEEIFWTHRWGTPTLEDQWIGQTVLVKESVIAQEVNEDGLIKGPKKVGAVKDDLLLVGGEWMRIGDVMTVDAGLEHYSDQVRRNPTSAKAWTLRAACWKVQGDFDRAMGDLEESIRLDPESADPYRLRGLIKQESDLLFSRPCPCICIGQERLRPRCPGLRQSYPSFTKICLCLRRKRKSKTRCGRLQRRCF